jgi:ABC-type multidrug transport system ATPase subunit
VRSTVWPYATGRTSPSINIGLAVPAGSFFGLVGPNGAGKTTSLSMAVGLLRGMVRDVVTERADELLRVLS